MSPFPARATYDTVLIYSICHNIASHKCILRLNRAQRIVDGVPESITCKALESRASHKVEVRMATKKKWKVVHYARATFVKPPTPNATLQNLVERAFTK